MVKYTGEKVRVRKEPGHVTFSKSSSMVSVLSDNKQHNRVEPPQYETRTAYYSAGSGIPEVKVILGGFVIKGFLGIKTLIVKSVGMVKCTKSTKPVLPQYTQPSFSSFRSFLHQRDLQLEKKVLLCIWPAQPEISLADCFQNLTKMKVRIF